LRARDPPVAVPAASERLDVRRIAAPPAFAGAIRASARRPARSAYDRVVIWTAKRVTVWGTGLLVLSWFVYIHTMAVPGYMDRAGRFKGTDYIYFYVMGSLMLDGQIGDLYDPDAHLAEARRRITPDLALYAPYSNYGPQVAVAFAPLAAMPFGWSLASFLALTAVAYVLSVWIVWRECPGLHGYGGVVALLAAASPAFFTLIRYAQLSAFSLLLWAAALMALSRNRRFAAGLAIGLMAFKPQLGLVVGMVLILTKEWRVVAGAATAAAGQLGVGWLASSTSTMRDYFGVLWTLLLNPGLVQIHPTEVHSLRGLFQLLLPWPAAVSVLSIAGLIAAIVLGVKAWRSAAPLSVRWGLILLLTILASPHLLTYDLILLTIPLLVFADWSAQHPNHPRRPLVTTLVLLLYLAPFSSNFARLIYVQLSVVCMVLLVVVSSSVTGWPAFRRGRAATR
jgi:hypothetical protein